MYHIAHGTAVAEYLVSTYFSPTAKNHLYYSEIGTMFGTSRIRILLNLPSGIAMVISGQVIRSLAMMHASTNFSHIIAYRKLADHRLVKDGIYR